MPQIPGQTRTSYAAGEVNPMVRAATDLSRFQTGVALCENMIVLLEATLTRRPGTRFIAALKTESQKGKMFPFRFSGSDYYGLAFNDGKLRLLKDDGTGNVGLVESSPGVTYELSVPWVEADMPNLRSAPIGKVILQACKGKAPQQITRSGATTWSIAEYQPSNGPVDTQNLDTTKTIRVSAVTGTGISLFGSGSPFDTGQVDGVFRIDDASQTLVPEWTADEVITVSLLTLSGASGTFGDVVNPANAFDGNGATVATKAAAQTCYVGESFPTAQQILYATISFAAASFTNDFRVTAQLWVKNGAPANDTDGIKLAELTENILFGNPWPANPITLTSSDGVGKYDHIWVRFSFDKSGITYDDVKIAEVVFKQVDASAPVERRWQSNVYQAISSGNAGTTAPTHTDGDILSGTGGVVWRYLHSGYGFVRVTAVADANNATGDVLSRLPDSLTMVASYRYSPPAWCDLAGWPVNVYAFKERIGWQRDNIHWQTQPSTLSDMEVTINDDSAIARRLIDERGSKVDMLWAAACSGIVIMGMRDNEWLIYRPKPTEAYSSNNIDEDPETEEGSQPQIPALVDKGVVFIGRDGKRLHYAFYDRGLGKIDLQEISIASRHIFGVGAFAMAWQQHPNKLLWVALNDGSLASVTFMPAEKVTGWARHPMTNCVIEDLISIPTTDNGASLVILQTKRTINAQTRRYYEQLEPFFAPLSSAAPTAEGAWFVDCGLRYQGAAATHITGLDHLIGQTVRILANGHEMPEQTVANDGSITLSQARTDVIVGLPITARVKDLPRGVNVGGGASGRGAPQRASHIAIDVFQSAGGEIRFTEQNDYEDLTDTGTMDYGAPLNLDTKLIIKSLNSATELEPAIDILIDTCLPFTLLATTPTLEIEDPE